MTDVEVLGHRVEILERSMNQAVAAMDERNEKIFNRFDRLLDQHEKAIKELHGFSTKVESLIGFIKTFSIFFVTVIGLVLTGLQIMNNQK